MSGVDYYYSSVSSNLEVRGRTLWKGVSFKPFVSSSRRSRSTSRKLKWFLTRRRFLTPNWTFPPTNLSRPKWERYLAIRKLSPLSSAMETSTVGSALVHFLLSAAAVGEYMWHDPVIFTLLPFPPTHPSTVQDFQAFEDALEDESLEEFLKLK